MITVPTTTRFGSLGEVCRLGLATRGTSRLTSADVFLAVDSGIDFLNWCGTPDGLSQAVAALGPRRERVKVCVQFEARTAMEAEIELGNILKELATGYVDVLTFYYVEAAEEWAQIAGPEGSLSFCQRAKEEGKVRMLGLTSHQRRLAASIAQNGALDMLMVRYNAAHRGAETDIFPVTQALAMPVVTFTGLRWGALLRGTAEDPPDFVVPTAPDWYRFVLQHPDVSVALAAPHDRAELEEDLKTLTGGLALRSEDYDRLAAHGQRVRRHAGSFP